MNENMNADDFEQRLQGQPMRKVPAEWRSQILSTAAAAAGSTTRHRVGWGFGVFEILRAEMVALLWPSPKAWVGLAAIWLFLAGANRATLNPAEPSASSGARPAAACIAAWKEQERILAELIQPGETQSPEASRPAKPQPRSELSGLPRMS
jgi:hypothetical protein